MTKKKQKLELTWIGKDQRPKLEPRILIENPEKSYHASERRSEDDIFDNMLIHGDNLLALKALEQDYAGKVKCVYIDPPFNTSQALEYYDDGIEHSLWLTLIRERVENLRSLLSDDGTLFFHIDDNELGYAIVLLDEVFGRENRRYIITFKQGSATGHKAINPGCVSITNYILIYSKKKGTWLPNRLFMERGRDARYNQFIQNKYDNYSGWSIITLMGAFALSNELSERDARKLAKSQPDLVDDFVSENAESVVQLVNPDYNAVGAETRNYIDRSREDPDKIFCQEREGYSPVYLKGGKRIIFYSDKMKLIDGQYVTGEPLTTLWDDVLSNNLHKEGGVKFPKSKKPEALIKRCIEFATSPGEIVLDSFLGSGTTAAVAHKMGRRWIGVELGDHADSHCLPRLKKVIDGDDQDGVSKAVDWIGGGGFRYFRVAPSLLERDRYGNWVISKDYKPEMMAEAMCKHMGFTYAPSQNPDEYWNHGYSTETDFIFVTTQNLTHQALARIAEDVGPDRSLLVCCKAFNANPDAFENLTIKKIPHAVLRKCEWGRDDYSLNVANLPLAAEDDPHPSLPPDDLPLFASDDTGEEA